MLFRRGRGTGWRINTAFINDHSGGSFWFIHMEIVCKSFNFEPNILQYVFSDNIILLQVIVSRNSWKCKIIVVLSVIFWIKLKFHLLRSFPHKKPQMLNLNYLRGSFTRIQRRKYTTNLKNCSGISKI